jgi:hypothetical protein
MGARTTAQILSRVLNAATPASPIIGWLTETGKVA